MQVACTDLRTWQVSASGVLRTAGGYAAATDSRMHITRMTVRGLNRHQDMGFLSHLALELSPGTECASTTSCSVFISSLIVNATYLHPS